MSNKTVKKPVSKKPVSKKKEVKGEVVRFINNKQFQDLTEFISNMPTKHGMPLLNFLNSLEKTTKK